MRDFDLGSRFPWQHPDMTSLARKYTFTEKDARHFVVCRAFVAILSFRGATKTTRSSCRFWISNACLFPVRLSEPQPACGVRHHVRWRSAGHRQTPADEGG